MSVGQSSSQPLLRPEVEGDAFLHGTATQILPPRGHGLNDHCFVQDAAGLWHWFGGVWHAVGPRPDAPMTFVEDLVFPPDAHHTAVWAQCAVVQQDTLYMFYADPVADLRDWRAFAAYVAAGRPFRMWLATAPVDDMGRLERVSLLFEEGGAARDPFVFWHHGLRQWVMLYARRIDPERGLHGEGGIAYRISPDLLSWSEPQGYVVRGFEDRGLPDVVAAQVGTAESPHLAEHAGRYYLFVTHVGWKAYHRTKVWASDDPLVFGAANEPLTVIHAHAPEVLFVDGRWLISNCGMHQQEFGEERPTARVPGVEVVPLRWVPAEGRG